MGYMTDEGPSPAQHEGWKSYQDWLDAGHQHVPSWETFLAGWDARSRTETFGGGYPRRDYIKWTTTGKAPRDVGAAPAGPRIQDEVGVPINQFRPPELSTAEGPKPAPIGPVIDQRIELLDRRIDILDERIGEVARRVPGGLDRHLDQLYEMVRRHAEAVTSLQGDVRELAQELANARQLIDLLRESRVLSRLETVEERLQRNHTAVRGIEAEATVRTAAELGKLKAQLVAGRDKQDSRDGFKHGVDWATDVLDDTVRGLGRG